MGKQCLLFHASGVCNKSGAIRFAIAPYGLDVLFPGKGQMHRLAGAQQLIKKISEPLVVFCDVISFSVYLSGIICYFLV